MVKFKTILILIGVFILIFAIGFFSGGGVTKLEDIKFIPFVPLSDETLKSITGDDAGEEQDTDAGS